MAGLVSLLFGGLCVVPLSPPPSCDFGCCPSWSPYSALAPLASISTLTQPAVFIIAHAALGALTSVYRALLLCRRPLRSCARIFCCVYKRAG